ncbi:hypothetical protein MCOO_49890 [Mycobacterium cookii]|uniref:Amidohydrolase n=1 Tax=Mycobacterium cookii TaxID=1775 RepID=A0A7I7L4H1_9MYCO|nr:hypothetical protein MCOO_49890 [Mycobacterium cookii]
MGPGGAVELDEAIAQAETERDVGALLLRDCGSPVDTRSLDDRDDLPSHHPRRPPSGPPEALHARAADRHRRRISTTRRGGAAGATRRRLVKLVGDWIDRIGDLAPLWSDDVLKAAIDAAHDHGARVAHVFGEDALPGLIRSGIDCIEHGTGLTDDIIELMVEHGTALVPTLINVENFPGSPTPQRNTLSTPPTCAICTRTAIRG